MWRLVVAATMLVGVVCAQTVTSATAGPVRFITINITSLGLNSSTIHAVQPQCWTGTGFSGSDVTGILTVRPIRAITSLTPTSIKIDVANDGSQYQNVVCSVGVGGGATGSAAAITGGAIDGTVIGGTTPAPGSFTTVSSTGGIVDDESVGVGGDGTITETCAQASNNCYTQLLLQPAGATWQVSAAGSGASVLPGGIYFYDGTAVRMTLDANNTFGIGSAQTGATDDPFYVTAVGAARANLIQGGVSAPSLAFVTGTGGSISGGNVAGTFVSSTTGTIKFTLTWQLGLAYLHRAVCRFTDETTNADTIQTTQATPATTTTLTATGTTVSGDVISYSCTGY